MNQNQLERTVMLVVREMTIKQLSKRVPTIPTIDYRRLTYCLVEDRMALYRAAGIKHTLVDVLSEFGITTTAYYAWYEKYHSFYQAM